MLKKNFVKSYELNLAELPKIILLNRSVFILIFLSLLVTSVLYNYLASPKFRVSIDLKQKTKKLILNSDFKFFAADYILRKYQINDKSPTIKAIILNNFKKTTKFQKKTQKKNYFKQKETPTNFKIKFINDFQLYLETSNIDEGKIFLINYVNELMLETKKLSEGDLKNLIREIKIINELENNANPNIDKLEILSLNISKEIMIESLELSNLDKIEVFNLRNPIFNIIKSQIFALFLSILYILTYVLINPNLKKLKKNKSN